MLDKELTKFLRFITVGILNTFLNYLIFYLAHGILNIFYILASVIGFLVAFINSFFLNANWTFSKETNFKTLSKFFTVNTVSLSVNIISLTFFVEILSYSPQMGQLLGISFSLIVNYIGNRIWVFNN